MSDEKNPPIFCVIPYRVLQLPDITIQLLRFYEKIFQFWNKNRPCFVGNEELKNYAGMSSKSSVSEAFQYFEDKGEIKRIVKNGRRYIVQPAQYIEIEPEKESEKEHVDNSESVYKGLAAARGGSRCSERGGLAAARHNNNNLNAIKYNKRKELVVQKQSNRKSNEVSDEYLNAKKGNVKTAEYYLSRMKGIQKPARYRNEQKTPNSIIALGY